MAKLALEAKPPRLEYARVIWSTLSKRRTLEIHRVLFPRFVSFLANGGLYFIFSRSCIELRASSPLFPYRYVLHPEIYYIRDGRREVFSKLCIDPS